MCVCVCVCACVCMQACLCMYNFVLSMSFVCMIYSALHFIMVLVVNVNNKSDTYFLLCSGVATNKHGCHQCSRDKSLGSHLLRLAQQ